MKTPERKAKGLQELRSLLQNMSSKALTTQGKEFLPREIGYLTESAIKKCEEELTETPERKAKELQELRYLLQKNPKSEGIDFYEDFLMGFLRRNKYRVENAHQQILKLIHLHETENIFGGISDEYLDLPSSKFIVLLPMRCQDDCALFICRWGKWDPSELPFEQLKRMLLVLMFQALRDPMTQINGFKIIHDLEGMSFKQLKYCTPSNMYLYYNSTVNCLPARYKEFHFISESYLFKIIWRILNPMMSEKIRNRVYLHNNKEELFHYFPRCIMPKVYGGDIQETSMEDWIKEANKEQKEFTLRGQPNYY
ncbi:unnamed protein product [Larinioides sclopetarius]|uniref:CRAL-TRIO domain-containing protein n=1 Tax=Larinioides sclopetarius TaxID=280406 RepID=A0AAV2A1V5_9ARAC